MKANLIKAIVLLLAMILDNQVKGLWSLVLIIYFLFINIHLSLSSEKKSIAHHFIFTFLFIMSWKIVYLNGAFKAFENLFTSKTQALLCFLMVFIIESMIPSLIGIGFKFLPSKKFHKIFFSAVLVFFINMFKGIWLPQGFEIPLSQSRAFMASYAYFSVYGVTFIVALCLSVFCLYPKRLKSLFALTALVIIYISGYYRLNYQKTESTDNHYLLVQTNQSELKGQESPVAWKRIQDDLEQVDLKKTLLIFPEYTAKDNDPYFKNFIDFLKLKFKTFDLLIGVEGFDSKKIKNEIWYITEQGVVDKYLKTISFPIGERELKIPFLPSKWLKPRYEVALGKELKVFKTRLGKVLPIICYEATLNSHWSQISELGEDALLVHFSKDSFLQSTNLLEWFDQFVRLKASEYSRPVIRIGTNSSSGYINQFGEYQVKSDKDEYQLIKF